MFKNKLFFLNYSFGEFAFNLLCALVASFVFSGLSLYCIWTVNLFFISLNGYMLYWSFKKNIYDSDIYAFCKAGYICFSFLLQSIWSCLKIIFIYQVLYQFCKIWNISKEVWFMPDLTMFQFVITLIIVSFFGLMMLGLVGMCISVLLSKIGGDYTQHCTSLIRKLKLNKDDTKFCLGKDNISGFISSNFSFHVAGGLLYKDSLINEDAVISYLNTTGIKFSDLNDDHIAIMMMYSI